MAATAAPWAVRAGAGAARGQGLPSGFYNVASCGQPGRKMFALLANGILYQHIYDWGPQYRGAEGSNFWSESAGVYAQLARATRALGPTESRDRP